jgi:hypothetical protein
MMMKTLRYMTALCAVLLLAACGGGDGEAAYEPKTGSSELTVESAGLDKTENISIFSDEVANITGATTWCRVTKASQGPTYIRIVVDENLTLSERKANVTVTSKLGDRLLINITQKAHAAETNTGVDDSHDNVSNQPAYAPVR